MIINSSGNVGIGTTNPGTYLLNVNGTSFFNNTLTCAGRINATNGILYINASENNSGGQKGIIFRNAYDIPNNNNYNCSILTYDHDNQGFCDGLSINAFDGVSICTGSNQRQERMRVDASGNIAVGSLQPLTKFCVKANYNISNSAFSIDASDPLPYNLKIYPYIVGTGSVGYKFEVNNQSVTSNIITIDKDFCYINKLRISGNDPNSIWQTSTAFPDIAITTSSATANIYHAIGNGNIRTKTNTNGFTVYGKTSVTSGNPFGIDYMSPGSLSIGSLYIGYGGGFYTGGNWTSQTNTAGLLMEPFDNT